MKQLFSHGEWVNHKYIVGIADKDAELDELHKLRYDIFNVELDEGIPENEATKRDIDKFDKYCDHLIIKETESNKIVATYRIHPSWKMNKDLGFYTATEFDISALEFDKRQSIEVGRACIHSEHRCKLILAILWIAIRRYCENNNVETLFGVASIPKCTIEELSSLYQDLVRKGHLINDGTVTPLEDKRATLISNPPKKYRRELLGSLLKGYFKLGAKVWGEPVFDPVFRCHDFMVILEMDSVNWDYIDSLSKLLNIDPKNR